MRPRAGFTAIELLTVVAIVAILAVMAVPSFSYLMALNRVKGTATTLQMTLLKARSEAVKRNASVTIDRTGADWADGWEVSDGDGNVLSAQGAVRGVAITPDPASLATVIYLRSGRVQSAASFEVGDPKVDSVKRCVSADLSGRPYVAQGECP